MQTGAENDSQREPAPDSAQGCQLRVVIPAFNEEARIVATVAEYCTFFGNRATIVVVANGCSDTTCSKVADLAKTYDNLHLVEVAAPIGKGGAVRLGMSNGAEPFVAYADADCSTKPSEIDKLLSVCVEKSVDGAIGSRWSQGAVILQRQPALRRLASRTFNFLVRILFALPFHDTQCGAKVFRRSAIETIGFRLTIANFAFDIDLLSALSLAGFRIVEVPITWSDIPSYSKVRLFRSALTMFLAVVSLRLKRGQLRYLPYADLLARAAMIPSKSHLKILFLSMIERQQESSGPTTQLRSLAESLEALGHEIHWKAPRTLWQLVVALIWYVTSGHCEIDAILSEGSRADMIFSMSVKPKLRISDGTVNSVAVEVIDSVLILRNIYRRLPYDYRLVRRHDSWAIADRTETL